ncbi:putative zinc finger motif, C2HC5-type-domain-containing protein [Xylariaceae sp. FL0016]|nr:putative zinc finger motif, C2HC5-type-domain-containing protein [Xylariaceae sp. FL0016]
MDGVSNEELKQVLEYATTLSKSEAVDHFRNLLGDSPEAVDFIATFNSKRQAPAPAAVASSSQPSSEVDAVPRASRGPKKKKKTPLHTPAPRQVADFGPAPGTVYNKKNLEDDYIARRPSPSPGTTSAATSGRASPAKSQQQPSGTTTKSGTPPPPKPPPSAAGHLISDHPRPKSKANSQPTSRSSTPAPKPGKTKVTIAGGTAMHGASTALRDLDDAIRALEITTNPTQAHGGDAASRRCDCVATRHPLLAAAPNCLSCGKVICVKEGLGPCTSCGTPLLSPAEVQSMIRELRAERGREKMAADRDAHRRADVARAPAPFSRPKEESSAGASDAEARALAHRDRLLNFQAQNARRTTVKDEAADFDVGAAVSGGGGGNIWASPEERARELKRQQKVLREMEWNARPEYEKRRTVVSIDLVGGKAVRRMAAMERPASPESGDEAGVEQEPALREGSGNRGGAAAGGGRGSGGTFSKNPLLGGLIKPIFNAKGKGAELEGRQAGVTRWRRVQDDLDNNEAVILDGGAYGRRNEAQNPDEPECG